MMKKLLLFLFLLLPLAGWSESGGARLIVWQKSGEKVYYDLVDDPITTFQGDLLVIQTTKGNISYQRSNVLRYTYDRLGQTGISLQPGDREVEMNREGNAVVFRGLKAGAKISVYGANGATVAEYTADGTGAMTVSVKEQPSGVYIIRTGSETIELIKP